METLDSFAQIEARRDALNISIARLCRGADLNQVSYWRLLSGKRRAVRPSTIRKLDKALTALETEQGR
ncbi:MAG: hypothetical protein AAF468_21880 [Pseudomonadota bacterium]